MAEHTPLNPMQMTMEMPVADGTQIAPLLCRMGPFFAAIYVQISSG